jgi:hypothetical protein
VHFWIYDVSESILFAGHEEEFLSLLSEAGKALAARGKITAHEAASWRVLDDATVLWRGADVVSTRPVLALAEALSAIVRGTHPLAPPGHEWLLGVGDQPETIRVNLPPGGAASHPDGSAS